MVTTLPWKDPGERLEEVEERVGDDHVVVDTDDCRYDHHTIADTYGRRKTGLFLNIDSKPFEIAIIMLYSFLEIKLSFFKHP